MYAYISSIRYRFKKARKMSGILGMVAGAGMNAIGQNQQMQNQTSLNTQQMHNQMSLNQQMQSIQQQNWDYTNYENQVKHIENAGLNAGLLYGMSGAGGSTMGGGSGGSAQGGSAPQNNMAQSAQQGMAMQMQQATLQSQIELNKANAKNAEADAQEKMSRIPKNEGDVVGLGYDNRNKKINVEALENLGADQITIKLGAQVNQEIGKAKQELTKGLISQDTYKNQVAQIKANVDNTLADTALKIINKAGVEAGIKVDDAMTEKLRAEIVKMQKEIELRGGELENSKTMTENTRIFQDSLITLGYTRVAAEAVSKAVDVATGKGVFKQSEGYEEWKQEETAKGYKTTETRRTYK